MFNSLMLSKEIKKDGTSSLLILCFPFLKRSLLSLSKSHADCKRYLSLHNHIVVQLKHVKYYLICKIEHRIFGVTLHYFFILIMNFYFRAICGRIADTLQGLPPPYRLNRPLMMSTTSSETRVPTKAPNFAVNWYQGCDKYEVVNTTTGKTEAGPSRLCKQSFLKRFVELCNSISKATGEDINPPVLYCDAKETVASYNVSKCDFMLDFYYLCIDYFIVGKAAAV